MKNQVSTCLEANFDYIWIWQILVWHRRTIPYILAVSKDCIMRRWIEFIAAQEQQRDQVYLSFLMSIPVNIFLLQSTMEPDHKNVKKGINQMLLV